MDSQRLFLFAALCIVSLLLWQAWQEDYGPKIQTPMSADLAGTPAIATSADVPAAPAPGQAAMVQADRSVPAVPGESESAAAFKSTQRIRVSTDTMIAEIDTTGGDIRQVDLLQYPVRADEPEQPFRLMSDTGTNIFIAQSGLLSSQSVAPDHHAIYTAEQSEYQLAAGANELRIPLHWTSEDGIRVTKVYTFHRNSYLVNVEHEITNNTSADWRGRTYKQLQRSRVGQESFFIYTYTGAVLSTAEKKYKKVDFDDMDKNDLGTQTTGGWAAMIQHYFLGAWVPDQTASNYYYSKSLGGGRYLMGATSPELTVAAGGSASLKDRFYVGPKVQDKLAEIAPALDLTVDYGLLTIIAKPLFWLMKYIHKVVDNWGWSIILLTLLVKLAFYKLSEASYRSMGNMRRLQPKLLQIRERFGDDRQRMSQAMMELYKKEKINPLGGCLPILVQIPVFIALYWVLLESVELRQAPFILWLNDLSTKDPYYVLPLLMGATMLIQTKLNPAPPDPIQAKVMMALPIIFTLFFAFFPSGLVLYWVVNNILSIAQQWYIMRRIELAAAK